jgi:hypothetical protein
MQQARGVDEPLLHAQPDPLPVVSMAVRDATGQER